MSYLIFFWLLNPSFSIFHLLLPAATILKAFRLVNCIFVTKTKFLDVSSFLLVSLDFLQIASVNSTVLINIFLYETSFI